MFNNPQNNLANTRKCLAQCVFVAENETKALKIYDIKKLSEASDVCHHHHHHSVEIVTKGQEQ